MANKIEAVLGESEAAATERALARLERYVTIETPSYNETQIEQLGQVIAADLRELGASVETVDAPGYGMHVVASFEGEQANDAQVVVLTHMDTVHPMGTITTQPFVVKGDRVEGPGTYDMKAGITVVTEALALLRRQGRKPKRPLRFVISCDEEIGSHSGLPLIEKQVAGAAAVLVPEPCIAGGLAKTARKGVLTYRMDVRGKAAHAGVAPQTGISAIVELARQIESIAKIARPDAGTTINVGVIGGGTASNVVAAAAFADIDVRVVDMKEGERVHGELMAVRPITEGTTVKVERTEQRPPLERTPAVLGLYESARAVARYLGHEMGEGASGGGSDGSFTAALGIPTLDGLGCDGGGAHAADEHVLIADIPYRVALFAGLLTTL